MAAWHRRLDGQELPQNPGHSGGQGGLACCSPGAPKSRTCLSASFMVQAVFSLHRRAMGCKRGAKVAAEGQGGREQTDGLHGQLEAPGRE